MLSRPTRRSPPRSITSGSKDQEKRLASCRSSLAVTCNFKPTYPNNGNSRHGRPLRDPLSLGLGTFLALGHERRTCACCGRNSACCLGAETPQPHWCIISCSGDESVCQEADLTSTKASIKTFTESFEIDFTRFSGCKIVTDS